MSSLKVVNFHTITLDGYIARENGEEDFLPHEGWLEFVERAEQHDNFIIGRETFEIASRLYEGFGFDDIKVKCRVIVTTQREFSAPGYVVVHSPTEALNYLTKNGIRTAFLSGGTKLNTSFMLQGLVDEIELTISPLLLGNGRKLLNAEDFEASLQLKTLERLSDDRIKVCYEVLKPRQTAGAG